MTYRTQTLLLVLSCYIAGPWLALAKAQDAGIGDAGVGDAAAEPETDAEDGAIPDASPSPAEDATALDAIETKNLADLSAKIDLAIGLVDGLRGRIAQLEGNKTITGKQANQYIAVLAAQSAQLKVAKDLATELQTRDAGPAAAPDDRHEALKRLDAQYHQIDQTVSALGEQITELGAEKGWSLVDKLLAARCVTAICFANGESKYWLGIEPLVELPVGFSSALGDTGLAQYINNHELRVDLAAGLRVWLFDDIVSISIYISKPLIDTNIRVEGSAFVYPGAAARRPFPGFSLGLFFDSIWIGFDRNELRNGDSDTSMSFNSDFPPNVVVSSAWTITIALQPITAFRTALGTANKAKED